MWRRFWQWINDRWPADAVIRTTLTEEIPGGATIKYSFGATALFLFILQAATGVWQLFYYVPTADHAYDSVSYLRTQVPFGWLIHNAHYWGATAMVALVLIHMVRVYIWGAYKNPRQLTWLLGCCLFLVTMGMMFFGPPLQWDEKGYWATEVGTSIAGTVPIVGSWVKRILLGGDVMGQLSVSRFFALHIALLPGLLATLILLHLVAFRRFGSVGPWREEQRLRQGPFWPDQVYKDLITASLVFLIVIALCVFVPPDFSGPADPLDTTYMPKPEWNFLFLYQALKLFPGKLEVVGTVGIPLVGVLVLLLVPFIDRRSERNPARRPAAMGLLFVAVAAVVALSFIGNASHPGVSRKAEAGAAPPPAAAAAQPTAPGANEGSALVQSLGCLACHSIQGKGGKAGPDLSDEASRGRSAEWLAEQVRNPKSHNPTSIMPSFTNLTSAQMKMLVEYLLSLKSGAGSSLPTPAADPAPAQDSPASSQAVRSETSGAQQHIGSVSLGRVLFAENCQVCHGPEGTDKVRNPGSDDGTVPPLNPIDRELFDPEPAVFVSRIDPFLQNGSTPPGPHPALKMPAFGRSMSLTQEQISNLEAYVLNLNGIDRARVSHPGLRPVWFFVITIAVFLIALLGFIIVRLISRGRGAAATPSPRI